MLTLKVCVFGFVGNVAAVYVLLKPSLRGGFSGLLTALVSFDALFLVASALTLGLPNLSETYQRDVFFKILPVCYSLSHIFRLCSAYTTVSVTLERFFAIVYPFKVF